ncbi:MAG: hypothetical protein HY319_30205 [Armatimonadetes bacterium]|nr:hypothetical protein [Armatimonadota bacterium]
MKRKSGPVLGLEDNPLRLVFLMTPWIRAGLVGLLLVGAAAADDLSGPLRVTLSEESWGTLYYVPGALKDYDVRIEENRWTVTSPLGQVQVTENAAGDLHLRSPQGEMLLRSNPEGLRVDMGKDVYEFLAGPNRFTVRYPGEELLHKFDPAITTISGKAGTLTVTENDGDYRIESPAGISTYDVLPDGFAVTGAPYKRHPYLYRGALFELAGVGLFVDFKRLTPTNSMTQFIDWEPILRFPKANAAAG